MAEQVESGKAVSFLSKVNRWQGYSLEGKALDEFLGATYQRIIQIWSQEYQAAYSQAFKPGVYTRVSQQISRFGNNVRLRAFEWVRLEGSHRQDQGKTILTHAFLPPVVFGAGRARRHFPKAHLSPADIDNIVEAGLERLLKVVQAEEFRSEDLLDLSVRINTHTYHIGLRMAADRLHLPVYWLTEEEKLAKFQQYLAISRYPSYDQLMDDFNLLADLAERVAFGIRHPGVSREVEFSALGDIPNPQDVAPDKQVVSQELKEEIAKLLPALLTPKERVVLNLRFGLIVGRIYTLEEVAEKLGISSNGAVRAIERNALHKLKHSSRTRFLRDCY